MEESEAERNFHDSQMEAWAFEDELINIRKELLENVDELLLRKRFTYIQKALKHQREEIDNLFTYVKYITIYTIILNALIIGVILCLILTN